MLNKRLEQKYKCFEPATKIINSSLELYESSLKGMGTKVRFHLFMLYGLLYHSVIFKLIKLISWSVKLRAKAILMNIAVSLVLQEITSRSRKPCVFHRLKFFKP
jgi:hypothetical protein